MSSEHAKGKLPQAKDSASARRPLLQTELSAEQLRRVRDTLSAFPPETEFELEPVDRALEVEIVVRNTAWMWEANPQVKPSFLFASQMYGSGKTFFCRYFTRILLRDLAECGPIFKSLTGQDFIPSDDSKLKALRAENVPVELIVDIACARSIYIDLRHDLFEGKISLKAGIVHAILFKATGRRLADDDPISKIIESITPEELFNELEKKTGFSGKWFIAIDEIGTLDLVTFLKKWSDTKNVVPFSSRRRKTLSAHYDLDSALCIMFNSLSPFVFHKNFFFFFAGRSAEMCSMSISRFRCTSPFGAIFVLLNPFSPNQIVEVITRTKSLDGLIPNADPSARLNDLRRLAVCIHQRTGGVLRMIFYTLRELRTKETLDAALESLDNETKHNVLRETSVKPSSEQLRDVFHLLILMQSIGINLTSNTRFPIKGSSKNEIEAIPAAIQIGFYLKQVEDGEYQIVTGSWISEALPPEHASRVLFGFFNHSPVAAVFDQGRLFEVVFGEALALRITFSRSRAFSSIPLLALSTFLAAEENVGKRENPLVVVKGFFKPKKEATASTRPTENYSADNWGQFLADLAKGGKEGCVCVPQMRNSHGPDLLFFKPRCITNFALKDMQHEDKSSFLDVWKEVKKCLVKPRAVLGDDGPNLVLFFISTQLNENIHKEMKGKLFLRYAASSKPRGWNLPKKEVPQIPAGCELIIPSEQLVDEFLGKGQLSRLHEFFASTEIQSKLESLSQISADAVSFWFPNRDEVPAAASGSSDGAATSRAAQAPAAAPAVERHLLFQDPKQPINIEWMHAFNEQIWDQRFSEAQLQTWMRALTSNLVETVGGLIKLGSAASMERWGIPGAIAEELYLQCHPEKR